MSKTTDHLPSCGLKVILPALAKTSSSGSYEDLSKERVKRILLDFSKVEYLNSSGISLVIQMLMEANRSGQKIQIFGLSPHFQKVFTMVGLTKYTALHPDEVTAKAAFAS